MKTNLRTKPDSIHSALPNVAALVAMTLPLGALEFRRIHAQPEAKLAVNWTTASPFSVYSNVGAAGVFDGTSWGKRWWTSVALWYAVNPIVSVYGEGISAAAISGSALPSRDGDVGITFLIDDRLQLDLRAGRGFGRWSATERFFGLGLARRW